MHLRESGAARNIDYNFRMHFYCRLRVYANFVRCENSPRILLRHDILQQRELEICRVSRPSRRERVRDAISFLAVVHNESHSYTPR